MCKVDRKSANKGTCVNWVKEEGVGVLHAVEACTLLQMKVWHIYSIDAGFYSYRESCQPHERANELTSVCNV